MQGVTFDLMRNYAVGELGETGWSMILKRLGRSGHGYDVGKSYPDAEFAQALGLVAQAMNKPMPYVLEGYGEAMVPEMIRVYGFLVDHRWSYMDFILNMQPMLEGAFRLDEPGAAPVARVRSFKSDRCAVDEQIGALEILDGPHAEIPCQGRGVRIGSRAVIGAGSIVTTDVPPRCVAAGNPARVLRQLTELD